MQSFERLPITVTRSLELVGLYVLGIIIYQGSGIITPLLLAFFVAILLLPIYRKLRRHRIPEVLSICMVLLLFLVLIGGMILFFSVQVTALVNDFPQIRANVLTHVNRISDWISVKMHFSTERQAALINEQSNKLLNMAGNLAGGAAGSLTDVLVIIGLLPIYIFLILYYKNLLMRFVFYWFPQGHHEKLKEVVFETESIIKSYLVGLLIQISYITILLGGTLLLFGIKHALLIGVIFAILNLIPYIGALIGNIIGVLLTLTSSSEITSIFIVLGCIAFVQFLDNNILMPRIVGSKVRINALATIVGVIVAGALAGVSGMFLSLPVIAVMKIIFDRTERFRHGAYCLAMSGPERVHSPGQFSKRK